MSHKTPIYVTQPYLPPLEEFVPYLEKIWANKILTNNGPSTFGGRRFAFPPCTGCDGSGLMRENTEFAFRPFFFHHFSSGLMFVQQFVPQQLTVRRFCITVCIINQETARTSP